MSKGYQDTTGQFVLSLAPSYTQLLESTSNLAVPYGTFFVKYGKRTHLIYGRIELKQQLFCFMSGLLKNLKVSNCRSSSVNISVHKSAIVYLPGQCIFPDFFYELWQSETNQVSINKGLSRYICYFVYLTGPLPIYIDWKQRTYTFKPIWIGIILSFCP